MNLVKQQSKDGKKASKLQVNDDNTSKNQTSNKDKNKAINKKKESISSEQSGDSANSAFDASNTDPKERLRKFEGEGISFKAKLIGSELVIEPRGDKMCQNSLGRLKAIIKGTNSHKKRIIIKISYEGVKVYDEKTSEILHHNQVPEISYIASDETDPRSFGYVCDVPGNAHQFICFKTSGPAVNVMGTISALFDAVLEKKKLATEAENSAKSIATDTLICPSTPKPADDKVESSSPFNQSTTPSSGSNHKATTVKPVAEKEVVSRQYSSFIDDDLAQVIIGSVPSMPIAPQSLIAGSPSSISITDPTKPSLGRMPSTASSGIDADTSIDRYAVFNDMDNLPSIFESVQLKSDGQSQQPQQHQAPVFPHQFQTQNSQFGGKMAPMSQQQRQHQLFYQHQMQNSQQQHQMPHQQFNSQHLIGKSMPFNHSTSSMGTSFNDSFISNQSASMPFGCSLDNRGMRREATAPNFGALQQQSSFSAAGSNILSSNTNLNLSLASNFNNNSVAFNPPSNVSSAGGFLKPTSKTGSQTDVFARLNPFDDDFFA